MSRFFGFLAYLGGRKLRILVPEPKSAEGLLWLYYQELGWGDVVGQVRWLLEYGRGAGEGGDLFTSVIHCLNLTFVNVHFTCQSCT